MVNTQTSISKKVLAIVLAVACMVCFTPAMAFTSSAHAAAWKVSPTKATVYVGKYKTLKSTKTAKWTSSKKSVAKLTASKGKTVKVKGVKAGKATIKVTYKGKTKKIAITVKKIVKVKGVTVTGTAKVGETLTATVNPANASSPKYQWYADGVAITGATKATYTLTGDQFGKAITVKVKGVSGSATSAATAKVEAATVTALKITGMTGKSDATKDADTPLVGDTLTAATTPAKVGVTYQWSVGGTAVTDATSATYKVLAADAGKAISVSIKAKDAGTIVSAGAATAALGKTVKKNIADYANIVLPVTKSNGTEAVAPKLNTAYQGYQGTTASQGVVVYNKTTAAQTTLASAAYDAAWYVDSVSTDNKIGDALALTVPDKTKYLGKKLILVLTGKGDYLGTAQIETPTVVTGISAVAVKGELAADATSTAPQVGEKLTASVTPKDATVEYKWVYGTSSNYENATTTLGTGSTYTVTASDIGKNITVIATGTGNYAGSTVVAQLAQPVAATGVKVVITNADAAAIGTALTAGTTPAGYAGNLEYKWYKSDTKTGSYSQVATGASYTPTAAGYYKVIGSYSGTAFTLANDGSDVLHVATKVPSAKVVNTTDAGRASTAALKGKNVVGDTLTATAYDGETAIDSNVSYQWYRGSDKIDTATSQTYKLTADDVAKDITCVVSAQDANTTYSGSAKTSAINNIQKGVVASIGAITGTTTSGQTLTAGAVVLNDSQATTVTDTESAVTYTWYTVPKDFSTAAKTEGMSDADWVKAKGTVISGATKSTYKLTDAEIGKKIVVIASVDGYVGVVSSAVSAEVTGSTLTDTITLSATSGTVTAAAGASHTATFTATSKSGGALTATSSDTAKATVAIVSGTVTVTGVAGGTATITVTSAAANGYAAGTATYTVTVTPAP